LKQLLTILITFILIMLMIGCGETSDETNDSIDNNFTILRGTVPGTLIEAHCEDANTYSTTSIKDGTDKHPFELTIPKHLKCELIMTTNEESEAAKVVTPIRFVTSEGNSTLFEAVDDIVNLGYVDLAVRRVDIIDTNNDGVSDVALEIKLIDGILEPIEEVVLSSSSSTENVLPTFSSSSFSSIQDSSVNSSFSSISFSVSSQNSSSSMVIINTSSSSDNNTTSSSSVLSSSSSSEESNSSQSISSSSDSSQSSSEAAPIYDEYNSTKAYTAGDRVAYEGVVYEAKWWTKGETPNDEIGTSAWKRITPIDGYLEYQNSKIYNVGDRVYYAGILYEAKWWIQGVEPSDLADGPWKRVEETP